MLEEALSVTDGLRLFTTGSAFTTFEESIKGMIQPGMLADLVVLAENPLAVRPDKIKDIKVDMTIIDGKVVFGRR